ncbi:hypothetical protein J4E90_007579 [Alternaria incomplexa]|uniref:uncharacterized protein n=1 Tax=Alternaria incomplexa TaxID=1187928 RepID=UPI0022205781|nr:uncharacterized protein J4E90_007579 [Alternaria incomplexa]KAI4910148.1 hypothetical protein J4E90_007579 [Alternaria incomplexa]
MKTPKQYQTMSSTTPTSSTPPAPQSSALPPTHPFNTTTTNATTLADPTTQLPLVTDAVTPTRKPLLRLELRDLSSNGTRAFLRLTHASHALEHAVATVLTHLYSGLPKTCIPGTRSVTLVLREMDGVAYTTGLDLDDDHKEIHLNTSYISHVPESRQKEEILGVLVHEMVHCWQHSGFGSAPTGLTEGVADWVRLKAGFAPPHWKRHGDCEWDAGYERTGYFLEWLEKEHGEDVVRRLNEGMREKKYDGEALWKGCCGKGVEELWEEYKKSLEGCE